MKPWRPYGKGLDLLMSEFLASPEPPQFAGVHKIHEWISGLKFPELMITHDKCYQLAEALSSGAFPGYHPTCINAGIRWQLILRCECALDFCRGRVGKRAAFNWDQDREAVYRGLLIEYWHRNALHWSAKLFGSSTVQAATTQARLQTQFWCRFAGVDPAQN